MTFDFQDMIELAGLPAEVTGVEPKLCAHGSFKPCDEKAVIDELCQKHSDEENCDHEGLNWKTGYCPDCGREINGGPDTLDERDR
jgi:hypothetical protein